MRSRSVNWIWILLGIADAAFKIYLARHHARITMVGWLFPVFMIGTGVLMFRIEARRDLPRERRKRGLCPHCGYDLTGNESGVCPECGTERDDE